MDLRDQIYRHRKNNRLIFGVLAGAIGVFTAVYYFILRSQELPPNLVTNNILLFVLRNINVLLILAVLFVLVRDLVKLWVERRQRILGSKFKTKLVSTYIALSLLPVLLLFAYANELIQGSIENLFRTPVRKVLEEGYAVSQELTERIYAANQRGANSVAGDIASIDLIDPEARPRLGEILTAGLRKEALDILLVYSETEFIHAVLDPQAGPVQLPDPGSTFLLTAVREGQARRILAPPGQDLRFILVASSFVTAAETTGVLVAGTVLDPEIAGKSESLARAFQDYRQLEIQKPDLKASYLLLILMVTLVILLTSSWVGLYLARRVTVPIQALAEGTRRVAEGDLEHQVDVEADDELGVLVTSFNRMTGELHQNRELLETKNEELTEANERLDEERSLISTVLRNVAAGVISVDGDGTVSTCNDAALSMLQQTEADLLGLPLSEAWSSGERRKLLSLVENAEPPAHHEIQLLLGGDWKTLEVGISPMVDPAGQRTGHVVVLEDLTQLIQAQKLATWNEAARRIAHEIKNPLTPIKLSAERLRKKYRENDEGLGTALEEGVDTIVREVGSMKEMVDEFSRFARMPRPKPTTVDLEELFAETCQLYRDIKPGLELGFKVAPDARSANVDKEQMKGVLVNLLDNAIEATPSPGRVELRSEAHNGTISLRVVDTGPGIPAETREKLFLPYYSTKGRGTGLGLSIVHRVVTDHNGSIRVEDNSPTGTVFTIDLPQE
ncbi:MAG: ATP-binding protein [Acidobacteriota bacterium]|nr:ATP-binding protein [Acidobacteriota bacterium]